jgi:HTH-type transcriptional regulator, sugar sensing transcriptional regulator
MNETELISHIEELGLSNKEARVYIASLMIGPASVQKLADQSGIKRVTTYVILESLIGLGLVSQTTKGKKTFFTAEDPSNLQRLIEKREHELADQKQNFEHILPQLTSLGQAPHSGANVKLYDSADGVRTLMNTFIQEAIDAGTDAVCGFSNLDQVYQQFPEFRKAHSNPQRTRAGIRSRFLYTSSEGAIMKQYDAETSRESRWIPNDTYPLHGDFTIVGSKIMMLSFDGSHPVGITIESQELANGMRAIFEMAWDVSEKYNKK